MSLGSNLERAPCDHTWMKLFCQDDETKVCGLGTSEYSERGGGGTPASVV